MANEKLADELHDVMRGVAPRPPADEAISLDWRLCDRILAALRREQGEGVEPAEAAVPAGVVKLLREARELIEADRLIEAGKAHRGEIFRCPVRQLCRGIDAALARIDKGSE